MRFVRKARPIGDPNLRRKDAGLNKYEKEIYDLYREAFGKIQNQLGDQKVLRDILDSLKAGSVSGVNNAVNWRSFIESVSKTVPTLSEQVVAMANLHSKTLPRKIRYVYQFEGKDPRAIAWAQTQAGKRIQGITLETQQAVADLIADGLRTKISREEIITQLRQTIGLDRRQSRALGNFYTTRLNKYLEDGKTYEEASKKAEKDGIRYRARLVKQRAIRIARTEISSAANAGRYLSWEEADARGLLPPDSKKKWIIARDERTCPICRPLDNTVISWQATFSTGDVMPPAHPNCRCTAVIVPGEVVMIKQVQKHAPGQHNQQSHAGGRGGSSLNVLSYDGTPRKKISSEMDAIIAEQRELEKKYGNRSPRAFEYITDAGYSKEDKKKWEDLDRQWNEKRQELIEVDREFYDSAIKMKSGRSADDSDYGFSNEKFGAIRDEYVVPDEKTLRTNAALRRNGRVTTKVQRFDSMVAEGTVIQPTRVHRAAILSSEQVKTLQPGMSFVDRGFQSVGVEASDAIFYGDTRARSIAGEKVLFDYTLMPGLNAVNVGYGEIVVQRSAKVSIVGLGKEGDYTVVRAEVSKE